jgi:hypothetical protein
LPAITGNAGAIHRIACVAAKAAPTLAVQAYQISSKTVAPTGRLACRQSPIEQTILPEGQPSGESSLAIRAT